MGRIIREALGLDTGSVKFEKWCVLDAELLLWDQESKKICPFDDLSNYMHLRWRYISALSPANGRERGRRQSLMAVFFDLLLLDDRSLLEEPYTERTDLLSQIVTTHPGRVNPIAPPF
jgi:DNA ligase-4